MTTTKRVEAADLRVGQVWTTPSGGKGNTGTRRTITAIANGRVHYEREDGWYSGQDSLLVSQFVEMANDAGMTCEAPPIPHPSALGDLYAACKAAHAQVATDASKMGGSVHGRTLRHLADQLRAAIAKAEGVKR
jgi:hypothetical protein